MKYSSSIIKDGWWDGKGIYAYRVDMSKIVYIVSRSFDEKLWYSMWNLREAERWSRAVLKLGAIPLCPWLLFASYADEVNLPAKRIIARDLLRRCDAVFKIAKWEEALFAQFERELACSLGLPEFEDLGALSLWIETEREKEKEKESRCDLR